MNLSRRRFLELSGAALSGLACRPLLRAQTRAGGIGLGFSLYGMKTLPIPDALDVCSRIGYRNVELCLNPGFPSEPSRFSVADRRAVKRRLEDLGLAVSAAMNDMRLFGNPGGHRANLESIKRAAQVVHDTVPGGGVPLETIPGGHADDWEKEKERAVEHLREWGDTAAANGVTIAIKGHAGMAINSPDRLLWLLRQAHHPAIIVNYDDSHFELEGYSLEESLPPLMPYVKLVTVKDWAGSAKPSTKGIRYLLPGQGHTDFAKIFRLLIASGYSGAALVEVSAMIFNVPGFDPVAAARKCYDVLTPALREAGQP